LILRKKEETMPTGVKRQEILDAYEANELSYDLWDAIEELETLAGPHGSLFGCEIENFRRIARDFAKETRRRVLDLVKRGIGDEQVQGRISYILRLAQEALRQERAELKISKFPLRTLNPEAASIARDFDTFEKYLNDFTRDIGNLAVEEWRRKTEEERERRQRMYE